jgi:uroporphyrinogen-III synthase
MIPRDLHVITTRAATAQEKAAAENRGIILHEMPLTRIEPVQPPAGVLRELLSRSLPWVFTSRNGVRGCRQALESLRNTDASEPPSIRYPELVFAVGQATASEAESLIRQFPASFGEGRDPAGSGKGMEKSKDGFKYGSPQLIVPEEHDGTGLAGRMLEERGLTEAIHWCGRRRRPELSEHLGAGGVTIHEIVVYDTHLETGAGDHETGDPVTGLFATGVPVPHAVLFYSPSAVGALAAIDNRPGWPATCYMIAIGATTAEALRMSGLAGPHGESLIFTAAEATPEAMMDLAVKLNEIHDE